MNSLLLTLTIILPAIVFAPSVFAKECLKCGLEVKLGGSLIIFDTGIRIDAKVGDRTIGDSLDLEDDLNLSEDDNYFFGGLRWRFAERHSISLIYWNYQRDAVARSEKDFRFGEEVLLAGAFIATEIKVELKDIDYTYDFYVAEKLTLGGSLGIYWSTREFRLEAGGDIQVDGSKVISRELNYLQKAKLDIPLPTLGLRVDYQMTPKLAIVGSGRYLKVKINDQEGKFVNLKAGLQYAITDTVDIGLAANTLSFDATSERSNFRGEVGWSYSGADLFLIVVF